MAYRVREALGRKKRMGDSRGRRGPADGLLAEIQADVLARNPGLAKRLRVVEEQPVPMDWDRGKGRSRRAGLKPRGQP